MARLGTFLAIRGARPPSTFFSWAFTATLAAIKAETVKNPRRAVSDVYKRQALATGRAGISEAYIYDATNIRLRKIALSYRLPSYMLKKTPFQQVKLGFCLLYTSRLKLAVRLINEDKNRALNIVRDAAKYPIMDGLEDDFFYNKSATDRHMPVEILWITVVQDQCN